MIARIGHASEVKNSKVDACDENDERDVDKKNGYDG